MSIMTAIMRVCVKELMAESCFIINHNHLFDLAHPQTFYRGDFPVSLPSYLLLYLR